MFGKRRTLIAILASVAVIALVTGCGSSTDHSSEWSSAEISQMKGEIAEKAPEFTDEGVDCVVDGVQSAVSPGEAEANDDGTKGKVEDVAKGCAEEPSNVQGILSEACQEEGVFGAACQEEIIEQATDEAGFESYEEEPYGAEAEYENEGLQEMDEELQQEYEEGEWGPESE
jgi:hypothetical protein